MSAAGTHTLDPLGIRRRLGRSAWSVPEPFGPAGWHYRDLRSPGGILVTVGPAPVDMDWAGGDWLHASIARPDSMPTYDDLHALHRAVWPDGWAYQVFAPPAAHISIHAFALHLWGRPDGRQLLPNFGALGSI